MRPLRHTRRGVPVRIKAFEVNGKFMPSLKERYLAEPRHELQEHYAPGGYRAQHLGFTREWAEANLPKSGTSNGFEIYLVDTEDNNKEYKTPGYVAWDCHSEMGFMDDDWNYVELLSLQAYFYGSHHCPCHRKQDAEAAGAATDLTCDGNRFRISRICVPGEDLILYSETMEQETLEAELTGVQAK